VGSAPTLTDTLIWQMNKTFRCEFEIAKCRERIPAIESRQSELDKVQDLNDLLQLSTDDDDRAELLRGLQDAEGMARCFNQVIAAVERKLKYWREQMELPKSQMFHDLQQVMAKNNILHHISN
jgi:hypothetical protein